MDPEIKNTSGLKALIIDDEYDICFLLSRILRTNNLEVQFVNSLSEGKSYLSKSTPDLLFLDNHLPDGYGTEFIGYVKENNPATKIVMITAHDTSEDRQKALKEGADVFISKPFSAAQIRHVVENIYP